MEWIRVYTISGLFVLLYTLTPAYIHVGPPHSSSTPLAEYSVELQRDDVHCVWDVIGLGTETMPNEAGIVMSRVFDDTQNTSLKYSEAMNLSLSLLPRAQPTPIFQRLSIGMVPKLTDPRLLNDQSTCWFKTGNSPLFPSGWLPHHLLTFNKSREEVLATLAGKVIMFAGDSTVREIYTELVSLMLNATDKAVVWPNKDKHADLELIAENITALFYWTPTIGTLQTRLVNSSGRDVDHIIAGVGAWHVWRDNITEYAHVLQKILHLPKSKHMSWLGIPYPVSLPGLRVPGRVRAWNTVTRDILEDSNVQYIDYYGLTRARANESDGNIHYGYWSGGKPGNCTRAALLIGLLPTES